MILWDKATSRLTPAYNKIKEKGFMYFYLKKHHY